MWGISGILLSAALITTAWVAPTDTAYGLCWGMPWLWAMILGAAQIAWTRHMLKYEHTEWSRSPTIHRERTLPITEGKYDPPAVPAETLARRSTSIPRISEARREAIRAHASERHEASEKDMAPPRINSDSAPPRKSVTVQDPIRESEKSAV
jgi:hypothetical protein